MKIAKNLKDMTLDVTLSGKFTFSDHRAFREILEQLNQHDVSQIVLHLGQVEFVDSAALGMLLLARDEASQQQKSLILSGASGQVKKMFGMARFDTLFVMS
jgi:anti-anti-sigma factor